MRGCRDVKVRIPLTAQSIRSLLCQNLKMARGNVYTVKVRHLCVQLYRSEHYVSPSCSVVVRQFLLEVLNDAIVQDLTDKHRIVVLVHKARELLACEEYED
jgi:hypothetical protein